MERLTGTFPATGNDGRQYTVHVYSEYIDASAEDTDQQGETEAVRIFKTAEGLNVTYRKKGEYQILQTGVVLRSDAPDAP
jgi:hypothetical protein